MTGMSDTEIVQHYSKESLLEYNGEKIPQALVDHVPSGLTRDQMNFNRMEGQYKLPPEIECSYARILTKVKRPHEYNGPTWRVCNFDTKSHTMSFVRAKYFDYLVTNLAAHKCITIGSEPLLYLLEDDKKLSDLRKSKAANSLGVGIMIITSDEYTFLELRSKGSSTYPGMLAPSASGGLSGASQPDPFVAIQNEIKQELRILPSEVTDLRYLGLTRELKRAGKPEMFFSARTSLNFYDVQKSQRSAKDASETEKLVKLDLDNVREPLPEENMSPAAKANLYFLLHYLRATR